MIDKNFHAHTSSGDVEHYKGYGLVPIETEKGWNVVIRRLDGKDLICDGHTKDHYGVMDNHESKKRALAIARALIDKKMVI